MKLLIVTQAVDTDDPVLGFFHRWIEEFAKHCERVEVICLREGKHRLPNNVRVHSLGKERGAASRAAYALRFLSLIWRLRRDYGAVFVHMNPEYILLAGLPWRFLQKPVVLWYVHRAVHWRLRTAALLAGAVLTASAQGVHSSVGAWCAVGHGIETDRFVPARPAPDRSTLAIVTAGRITRAKRLVEMLLVLDELHRRGEPFRFTVVGGPATPADRAYAAEFAALVALRPYRDAVRLLGPVPHRELPGILAGHSVFLNLSLTGGPDKAVLEAMAAGLAPVTTNVAFAGVLPEGLYVREFAPSTIADALQNARDADRTGLTAYIRGTHSLPNLIDRIVRILDGVSRSRAPWRARSLARGVLWPLLRLFARLVPSARPRLTALLYHSVSTADNAFAISPQAFARQLTHLKRHVDVITPTALLDHLAGKPLRRDAVVLTFDDGYRDFRDVALPFLRGVNAPATVFALADAPERAELGNKLPVLTLDELTALKDPLVTVGSHGLTHRKLTRLPLAEARREIVASREAIAKATGSAPAYFAYPKGSYNETVKALAESTGYVAAFTAAATSVPHGIDRYTIPRIQIDRATSFLEFKAKLTPAADWYYHLWRLFRRPA